jgi:hypothetical protein
MSVDVVIYFSDFLISGFDTLLTVFKTGKLDCMKTSVLMVAALNHDLGLRCAEHHRLLCAYSRRRCLRTPSCTRLNGVGGLELVATSCNTTRV